MTKYQFYLLSNGLSNYYKNPQWWHSHMPQDAVIIWITRSLKGKIPDLYCMHAFLMHFQQLSVKSRHHALTPHAIDGCAPITLFCLPSLYSAWLGKSLHRPSHQVPVTLMMEPGNPVTDPPFLWSLETHNRTSIHSYGTNKSLVFNVCKLRSSEKLLNKYQLW